MSRSVRWSARLGVALLALVVTAGVALAAITLDVSDPALAGGKVGGNYTWNYGNSLESTSCDSTTNLNALYATDDIKGTFASDAGPYQGVYATYADSSGSPLSWSKPKRVSQSTIHAERPSLAADGSNVFALWVSQTSYDAYDSSAKRVAYVRTSPDCGATWNPIVKLTSGRGQVDYPILAADDGYAYVIYTNAKTGDVKIAISIDGGAVWTQSVVGSTTSINASDTGEGYYSYPSIAASGANVAAGWYTDSAGRQVVIGSDDHGTTWSSEVAVTATSPNDTIHYMNAGGQSDGTANRIALAYTTDTGVEVREWNGASLSAAKAVMSYGTAVTGAGTFNGSYGPAPLPYATTGLTLAFPNCQDTSLTNDCNYLKSQDRTSMLLEDSPAGTFADSSPVVVASAVQHRYINDSASIVTLGTGSSAVRYVMYNGWTYNYFYYRQFIKLASGAGPS